MDDELKQEVAAELRKKITSCDDLTDQQLLELTDGTLVLEITVLAVALRRFLKAVREAIGMRA